MLALNARDAGDGPLANRRHKEAVVLESTSVFTTNISWAIKSCYLSLSVGLVDPQAITITALLRLQQTALSDKFEVLIMT